MEKPKTAPSEEQGGERRDYFRIDDDLSIILYKLESAAEVPGPEGSFDETGGPLTLDHPVELDSLWKLMVHLNKKLDLILERMPLDLLKMESQPVNLSATGLRTTVRKRYELNERVKVRMLLPTLPAKEVVLCGRVVRISPHQNGNCELAVQFEDVSQDIQNEIVQHTLKHQRKSLIRQKEPERDK
jgi:hypothetical protein